jgi:hypothetical protein
MIPVLIVMLLVAGCMGLGVPQAHTEPSGNPAGTDTYWLRIAPIGTITAGDAFTVNATTNLPVGKEVRCELSSLNMPPGNPRYDPAIIPVLPGENGLNRTVLAIDSGDIITDSRSTTPFTIIERAVRENAKDIAPFRVDGIQYTILLDPISDKHFGDTFTVVGRTNLPVGDVVAVSVHSNYYESGTTGRVSVAPGTNGQNATSFMVDTTMFLQAEYDDYVVHETYSRGDISLDSGTDFSISSIPEGPFFITIYPYKILSPAGNQTFTATTSLPSGDDVFWEFRTVPAPGSILLNGTVKVTDGDAGLNRTAFTIDDSVFGGFGNFVLTEKAVERDGWGYKLFFVVPVPGMAGGR